jgi:uncharacterized protein YkwD
MRGGPARAAVLLAVVLVAGPAAPSQEGRQPAASSPSQRVATLERQTHAKVNDYRASRGLIDLAWSEVIAEQARQHSRRMAAGATAFGHDGFRERAAGIDRKIPWNGVAENVFMMSDRPTAVTTAVSGWIDSPGHRRNIEGDFNMTGVGIARAPNGSLYFTQIFVKAK